jgi:hypothetical protein
MVHIMFQGVSLEALARRLMVSYDCQTADLLLLVNSRKLSKNSALQLYNTAIHFYDLTSFMINVTQI